MKINPFSRRKRRTSGRPPGWLRGASRVTRAGLTIGAVVLALVGLAVVAAAHQSARIHTVVQRIAATSEPDGRPVDLDSTLYVPAATPAPAVLLAQGFGGSKADLDSTARSLASSGFVVLAYTARGFGSSGGLIHLDSLDYEVKDARRLIDWLGTRPEVAKEDGRPQVAVAGSSYGGALALMLAGTDRRVDAVAADITWNDLAHALFPNGDGSGPGVWKKLWAGYLFQAGISPGSNPSCGRFAPDVCAAYQRASSTGRADAATLALLARSSPSHVTRDIRVPVLLSQGEQDSLFPLSEADANARQIAASGASVRVVWRAGGHDGGGSLPDATLVAWFKDVFAGRVHGAQPFELTSLGSGFTTSTGQTDAKSLRITGYPAPRATASFALTGRPHAIAAPAGGVPAALTSGPGLGALGSAAGVAAGQAAPGSLGAAGQTARFCTGPLRAPVSMGGSATVDLSVRGAKDATLFVSLHDVSSRQGGDVLPAGLVTPVRVARPRTVRVALPWIVHSFAAGHRICLEVGTTDLAYFLPTDPRTYVVGVRGPLTLSTVAAPQVGGGYPIGWVWAGLAALVLAAGAVLLSRPRAAAGRVEEVAPVVVDELVKEYGDGYRAVDGVSFQVHAGQVVGLLGPNGAGKTTLLRVLVGLIRPTAGGVRVFGEPIRPGAPVLTRVGAFIEGPGFLPHLSGRDNLRLYWAATARPSADAHLDVALDIAGLGESVHRKVKTYSHGMRQRLGIAQAMLGLPDVLVLDEPTNGLDPPQIAEMREVMRAYARTGRTVLVSSHLLAEVEQTCTHVVVMHKGKVMAAGSVAEVAGADSVALSVADPARAAAVLDAAGIPTQMVPGRRALEDVFLHLVGEDEA